MKITFDMLENITLRSVNFTAENWTVDALKSRHRKDYEGYNENIIFRENE